MRAAVDRVAVPSGFPYGNRGRGLCHWTVRTSKTLAVPGTGRKEVCGESRSSGRRYRNADKSTRRDSLPFYETPCTPYSAIPLSVSAWCHRSSCGELLHGIRFGCGQAVRGVRASCRRAVQRFSSTLRHAEQLALRSACGPADSLQSEGRLWLAPLASADSLRNSLPCNGRFAWREHLDAMRDCFLDFFGGWSKCESRSETHNSSRFYRIPRTRFASASAPINYTKGGCYL